MKKKKAENYLVKIPQKNEEIAWKSDEAGNITLEVVNKGVFNRIAQKLLKKPKISYIHLDEMGNFVWPIIDGEKDITQIGKEVEERFGEKANPLYERLIQYFRILESYGFVKFKD